MEQEPDIEAEDAGKLMQHIAKDILKYLEMPPELRGTVPIRKVSMEEIEQIYPWFKK